MKGHVAVAIDRGAGGSTFGVPNWLQYCKCSKLSFESKRFKSKKSAQVKILGRFLMS